jgi:Mg2+-importing ATPase
MLPVQLLLLNFFSDFPMLAIATDHVTHQELKRPARYDVKGIVLLATILGIVSTFFDFIFFILFRNTQTPVLQTSWFVESILTELVFIFSIRTSLPFYKGGMPSLLLLGLSLCIGVLSISLPFTHVGQSLFSFVPITVQELTWIFGIVAVYFITNEAVKLSYYKMYEKNHKQGV